MCLKLEDGAVLFSDRDMRRLRQQTCGAMGSRSWAARFEPVTAQRRVVPMEGGSPVGCPSSEQGTKG